MASLIGTPTSQCSTYKSRWISPHRLSSSLTTFIPLPNKESTLNFRYRSANMRRIAAILATTFKEENPSRDLQRGTRPFVDEMRLVSMKLHTKDQAKGGEKESQNPPLSKWKPSIDGYLRFLVDSKSVHDSLERIISKSAIPWYSEFEKTGLERSASLGKDLEWFKEQGHAIPNPSSPGVSYARYLEELSERDPQAFLCHLYNIYFAHTSGGRIIGKKVSEKILGSKELEFYKWEGKLSELLESFREIVNKIAERWSREEKDHCLEETENSFEYSTKILNLITC